MEAKRGEQAYGRPRHAFGRHGEAVMLAYLGACEDVEPATDALDETAPLHATEALPGDPVSIEVPRPEHSVPPDEVLDLLALRLAHRGGCDTKRR